jgi:6-phosphofructokinase 2
MKKIVTITMNPAIDKSSNVEHVVAERKLYCTTPHFEPGGGGINVSRAIKKLGGESLLLYPAGGLTGQRLKDLLDEEGLNHKPFFIESLTRENLIILDESTKQQFRFGMPGASLQEKEWRHILDEIAAANPKPDFLVASGSLPPGVPDDFYASLARIGKEHNIKVVIDASGEPLKLALRENVFLIKPNIREFRELIGEELKVESEIKQAAREIVESGQCEVIVISLGAAGAIAASKGGVQHIVPPTVHIISKVGAGDSMVAGIVLSQARDKSIKDSIRYGIAAGSAAVMTPGTELCRREDTERLFKEL